MQTQTVPAVSVPLAPAAQAPTRGKKKHVVILGAGFGGLAAARELMRRARHVYGYDVTVIDRRASHLFTPLLYEVAAGFIDHDEVSEGQLMGAGVSVNVPLALGRVGAAFVQAGVTGIDWERRTVLTNGEGEDAEVPFDFLIVALGSEPNFYGIPNLREQAFSLKSMQDADRMRRRLHQLIHEKEKHAPGRPVSVIVAGGGATGVELTAEIAMLFRRHVGRGHLAASDFAITLVDTAPRLLSMTHPQLSRWAEERLRRLGVSVLLDACVKRCEPGVCVLAPRPLKPGEDPNTLSCDFRHEAERPVAADILAWTAGVRGGAALSGLGMQTDASGRLVVDDRFVVQGHEDVFAIGDAVALRESPDGKPVPWLAQAAIAQGKQVAETIARRMSDGEDVRYDFSRAYVFALPLGGKYALLQAGSFRMRGFLAWIIRGFADLDYFRQVLGLRAGIALWWHGLTLYVRNDRK